MSLTTLQSEWTILYRTTLPTLANSHTSKTASAPDKRWPVTLDHCFARIVLDNAVGITAPWTEVLKAPATKNMSEDQLQSAISLGRRIADGTEDLWALDDNSLVLRGKQGKGGQKRKRMNDEEKSESGGKDGEGQDSAVSLSPRDVDPASATKKSRKAEVAEAWSSFSPAREAEKGKAAASDALLNAREAIISDESMKPFRKHVLMLLTQVPRGKYTTYQALSDAAVQLADDASATPREAKPSSGRGNARAIGGAMRNNPFAPTVPCHRVLASDGKLGGFGGHWGEDGKFASEKKRLLREEGVMFDVKGKVVGAPWRGFESYRERVRG